MKQLLFKILVLVIVLIGLVILCIDRTPPINTKTEIKITDEDMKNLKNYIENNILLDKK